MKAKTIRAVIRKNVDEWLASIDDERVRKLAADNTVVTGGCIASMLLDEDVNDFDVYLRTRQAAAALADYYVARFQPKNAAGIPCAITVDHDQADRIRIVIKSAGIASNEGSDKPYEYFESRPEDEAAGYVADVMRDPGDIQDAHDETEEAAQATDGEPKYRPVFMSTNAITLSQRLQIVIRFFGEPAAIHANYDFVHCTNYWTSWGADGKGELKLNQPALESLLARELRYVGSKYPICSVVRMRKFLARGWTINAGQILKMLMQAGELDLTDTEVLQDQLTGVDAAYFAQFLSAVRAEGREAQLDCAYLIEIIDRMF